MMKTKNFEVWEITNNSRNSIFYHAECNHIFSSLISIYSQCCHHRDSSYFFPVSVAAV